MAHRQSRRRRITSPSRRGARTSICSTAAIAAASFWTIACVSPQPGSVNRFSTTCVDTPVGNRTDKRCTEDVMPPSMRRPPVTRAPAPTVRSTHASCADDGNRRMPPSVALFLRHSAVSCPARPLAAVRHPCPASLSPWICRRRPHSRSAPRILTPLAAGGTRHEPDGLLVVDETGRIASVGAAADATARGRRRCHRPAAVGAAPRDGRHARAPAPAAQCRVWASPSTC